MRNIKVSIQKIISEQYQQMKIERDEAQQKWLALELISNHQKREEKASLKQLECNLFVQSQVRPALTTIADR